MLICVSRDFYTLAKHHWGNSWWMDTRWAVNASSNPAGSWNRAGIAEPISICALSFPKPIFFLHSEQNQPRPKILILPISFLTSKSLLHAPAFFKIIFFLSHPAFSAWFCLLEIVLHYERATGEEKKLLLYLALIFPLHSESQKLTFN